MCLFHQFRQITVQPCDLLNAQSQLQADFDVVLLALLLKLDDRIKFVF